MEENLNYFINIGILIFIVCFYIISHKFFMYYKKDSKLSEQDSSSYKRGLYLVLGSSILSLLSYLMSISSSNYEEINSLNTIKESNLFIFIIFLISIATIGFYLCISVIKFIMSLSLFWVYGLKYKVELFTTKEKKPTHLLAWFFAFAAFFLILFEINSYFISILLNRTYNLTLYGWSFGLLTISFLLSRKDKVLRDSTAKSYNKGLNHGKED